MKTVSISAATAAQKDAGNYLFGKNGAAIVIALDKLNKVKEINMPHLDGFLNMIKNAPDEDIIKFRGSPSGKKSIAALRTFVTAKTLMTALTAIKSIRVPAQWINTHEATVVVAETTAIRASKTSGKKPAKPDEQANPHAPDAVTVVEDTPNAKPKTDVALVDEMADINVSKFGRMDVTKRCNYFEAFARVLGKALVTSVSDGIYTTAVLAQKPLIRASENGLAFEITYEGKAWQLRKMLSKKALVVFGETLDVSVVFEELVKRFNKARK